MVRMGTSFTSLEGATANLEGEIPDWDFDAARSRVEAIWEQRLGMIEVEGGDPQVKKHFYTSFWRASLSPRMVSDLDAEPDFDDFNLWDTFRALHPLHTIIQPKRSGAGAQIRAGRMDAHLPYVGQLYQRNDWRPRRQRDC